MEAQVGQRIPEHTRHLGEHLATAVLAEQLISLDILRTTVFLAHRLV
jgi:hypothetical protein